MEDNDVIKKSDKSGLKKVGKYARELSVVILGIAITFSLNGLISKCSEQNSLEEYLNAIKLELQNNLELVEDEIKFYKDTEAFSRYLLATKQKDLHPDSLARYKNVMADIRVYTLRTSSFEMFKISGAMRLLKNKQLLSLIIETYESLERAKLGAELVMSRKLDEIHTALLKSDDFGSEYDLRDPKLSQLYSYYKIYPGTHGNFAYTAELIKETLLMLE